MACDIMRGETFIVFSPLPLHELEGFFHADFLC